MKANLSWRQWVLWPSVFWFLLVAIIGLALLDFKDKKTGGLLLLFYLIMSLFDARFAVFDKIRLLENKFLVKLLIGLWFAISGAFLLGALLLPR